MHLATSKIFLDWQDVERLTHEIIRKIVLSDWRPDYVVGITRGGLIPANLISQWFNCRMETLQVRLRDGHPDESCESNLWMAEDAFGYVPYSGDVPVPEGTQMSDPARRKNILVVDDINDSGATLDWIVQDWQRSALPDHPVWQNVWHHNVRFATLMDNAASDFTVDYQAQEIDKVKEPSWIVFPWEEWWLH